MVLGSYDYTPRTELHLYWYGIITPRINNSRTGRSGYRVMVPWHEANRLYTTLPMVISPILESIVWGTSYYIPKGTPHPKGANLYRADTIEIP